MTTTKYKIHGSFQQERKATQLLNVLTGIYGEYIDENKKTKRFHVHTKSWKGKDKTKYQVRETIRKGAKRKCYTQMPINS